MNELHNDCRKQRVSVPFWRTELTIYFEFWKSKQDLVLVRISGPVDFLLKWHQEWCLWERTIVAHYSRISSFGCFIVPFFVCIMSFDFAGKNCETVVSLQKHRFRIKHWRVWSWMFKLSANNSHLIGVGSGGSSNRFWEGIWGPKSFPMGAFFQFAFKIMPLPHPGFWDNLILFVARLYLSLIHISEPTRPY